MKIARLLASAALVLVLAMSSGCTFTLWSRALKPASEKLSARKIEAAWVDSEKTLHVAVKYERGEKREVAIPLEKLVPLGGDRWTAQVIGDRPRPQPGSEILRVVESPSLPRDDLEPPPVPEGAAWLVRRSVGICGEAEVLDLITGRRLTFKMPESTRSVRWKGIIAAALLTPITLAGDAALVLAIGAAIFHDDDD